MKSVDIPNMGCHLILDFHGTSVDLNDFAELDKNFTRIILDSGATIEKVTYKTFEPQGLSILYLLSESHFSIHTWPEFGACAIDFYHCGETARSRMLKAEELLCAYLGWENCTGNIIIDRGSYNYALITHDEHSSVLLKKHKLVNRFKTTSGETRMYSPSDTGQDIGPSSDSDGELKKHGKEKADEVGAPLEKKINGCFSGSENQGKVLAVDGVIQIGFHNIVNLGTLFSEDEKEEHYLDYYRRGKEDEGTSSEKALTDNRQEVSVIEVINSNDEAKEREAHDLSKLKPSSFNYGSNSTHLNKIGKITTVGTTSFKYPKLGNCNKSTNSTQSTINTSQFTENTMSLNLPTTNQQYQSNTKLSNNNSEKSPSDLEEEIWCLSLAKDNQQNCILPSDSTTHPEINSSIFVAPNTDQNAESSSNTPNLNSEPEPCLTINMNMSSTPTSNCDRNILIVGTGDLSLPYQMIAQGCAEHITVLDSDVFHKERLNALLNNNKLLRSYIDTKRVEFVAEEAELPVGKTFVGVIVLNNKSRPKELQRLMRLGAFYSQIVFKEAEFIEICKYENFHKLSFHEVSNTITRFLIGKARYS